MLKLLSCSAVCLRLLRKSHSVIVRAGLSEKVFTLPYAGSDSCAHHAWKILQASAALSPADK